ncbi:hypothetical protein HPG69_008795 [Diceros bicornis minor]|uniref:H15 domain-containing protein n=1 Tax=Diceros bicornis minor TaxID=77932 RepID=A0A7J7FB56_DICBM|nr:hypothetical protein HPG69_008795 [Diceros bicornis minor]
MEFSCAELWALAAVNCSLSTLLESLAFMSKLGRGRCLGDAPITAHPALYKALRGFRRFTLVVACYFLLCDVGMPETAPAASVKLVVTSMEKSSVKKRGKKQSGLTVASRKVRGPSVSKLITDALLLSQERGGMSLAALKKALAAAGYDVEKNNSRIKLGLKSLVSKGTLVQTRGTGAAGSFKLSKKRVPEPAKGRVKKTASAKTRKVALSRDSKSSKRATTDKRARKPGTAAVQKPARSSSKSEGAQSKQQFKSPAKSGTAMGRRSKSTQRKTNRRNVVSKK